ncbi:MAG: DUF4870 domain-containing protein [Planctomycetes bacterium]|nr:DUF4870 domain-containing protein [Planctomycetota bacterium]
MATDPMPPTPLAPGLPTDEEKLWGMLAHVSALLMLASAVGQFIAPLVIYIIYKDKSKFIAFHALQSLYWQLAILLVGVVICGVGVLVTIPLGLIMAIVAGIKAYDGELYEYWVVGEWARRQVGI